MVFQDTSTIKAGKLRPLSNDPILLQRALVFLASSVGHSDFSHHSFYSPAARLRVLVQAHVHRPHVGRPLACFGGFRSFFFFFSFSLPVIAQTQEMKRARKEIRQLIPASACR